MSDIHEVHRINLTTLGQEFQALNIDIQNELVDLSKVNDVLKKAANIKEITIFDPTDIKLDKITESNTALKIVTWAVAILAFGLIIFCIVSCCPVQIFAMLKATFKAILTLLTCTCTTAFMTTSSITRFMRRRQHHLHTSPATNSELNESTDQPGATITYMPHSAFRRRLFQGEEDSDDELTVYSAQRIRQQQQQRQDYREVQKQLDQRRSQSFELTQLTTSPPPYCAGLWRYMVVYMTVSHYSLGMVTRTWSTLYLQRQFLI